MADRRHLHRAALRLSAAVIATAVFTSGCGDEGSAGPDESFTMQDIVSEPGGLVGEEVAVSAEVGEVFPPYAFMLQSGEEEPVLVVSPDVVRVVEASVVQVIGHVVDAPVSGDDVPDDVAAFVENVVGEDHRHAIVASQVNTLEEPGEY